MSTKCLKVIKDIEIIKINKANGTFWMCLEDFINKFSSISIVRIYGVDYWNKISIEGSWKGKSAGGCTNYPNTYQNNPQFKLIVIRNTPAVITIQQRCKNDTKGNKLYAVGWSIFDNYGEKVTNQIPRATYKSSCHSYDRDYSVEIPELKAQQIPYTLVVSTFEPGDETDFTVNIMTKENVFIRLFNVEYK